MTKSLFDGALTSAFELSSYDLCFRAVTADRDELIDDTKGAAPVYKGPELLLVIRIAASPFR